MSWPDFERLLTDVFAEINSSNSVPALSDLQTRYSARLTSLVERDANIDRHVSRLSLSESLLSPNAVELARLLTLLRQRFDAGTDGKLLVGKVRAEVLPRLRPPFNRDANSLGGEAAEVARVGSMPRYSDYQIEGWRLVIEAIHGKTGLVVTAPTGAGKSEVFMLPMIWSVANAIKLGQREADDPRYVLLYPRVELLKDQLERVLRYVYHAERSHLSVEQTNNNSNKRRIIVGFQFGGIGSKNQDTLGKPEIFDDQRHFNPVAACPICKDGRLVASPFHSQVYKLKCTNLLCDGNWCVTLSKQAHVETRPHFLLTTDESLGRFYITARPDYSSYLASITGIVVDEAHLWYSLHGAHLYNLIQHIEGLKPVGEKLTKIASSATMSSPDAFAAKLFYGSPTAPISIHSAANYEQEYDGLETLFFVQASALTNSYPNSTMIQAAMALGHGLFAEANEVDTRRALLFTDSLDMASRFQAQITDAEARKLLWQFRSSTPAIRFHGQSCPRTNPANCRIYSFGECWRGIVGGTQCATSPLVRIRPLDINVVSSKRRGNFMEGDIVVATSSLEVGVDDNRIAATLHYRPPRDVFSFIQRRGRAGRSRSDIATSLVVLGNEATDQFYLYRRNRLLNLSDYELPFNPQNQIIFEMHRHLKEARDKLARCAVGKGIQAKILEWFYHKLEACPVIVKRYRTEIDHFKGIVGGDRQQSALMAWFRREREKFGGYLNVVWALDEVENLVPVSHTAQLAELRSLIDEYLGGNRTVAGAIHLKISNLSSQIVQLLFRAPDDEGAENDDDQEVLGLLPSKLLQVWNALKETQFSDFSPSISRGLFDFFRVLSEKLRDARNFNYEPDVIRTTMQALFYLGLETKKDPNHSCRSCMEFFVPDTFFQQVRPLVIELRTKYPSPEPLVEEENVTGLATQFFPYRTSYRFFGERYLSLLETVTDEVATSDSGTTVYLKLRGDAIQSTDQKLLPQKIFVRSIFSDEGASGFVKLCESCFTVHGLGQRTCCDQRPTPVSLWAESVVERRATASLTNPPQRITRSLTFMELRGDTTVLGSDVSAKVLFWDADKGHFGIGKNNRRIEFAARYRTPIAYQIPTKGIQWDLSGSIQRLMNDAHLAERLSPRPLDLEILLHTAVHMLLKAISAISGVGQDALEYAIEHERGVVTVWERYEGGAGISEILRDALRSNPVRFYQELLASVLCPIHIEETFSWTSEIELRQQLADSWFLSSSDKLIIDIAREAQAERTSANQPEREADEARNCVDGCPVCIQIAYCTVGRNQMVVISHRVAEAILRSFVGSSDKSQYDTLFNEALTHGLVIPSILDTDPATGVSHVLLL